MHPSRPESPFSSGPPQPAPRLGELLLEMGLITLEQLEAGLSEQKRDKRRLGTILVELGIINETRLVKALSRQLGIEVCDPITAPVHEMVRSKISPRSARELRVVPIALKREAAGERLFVATSDPLNNDARRRLQTETGMRVEWLLAGETELDLALARHYGSQRPSFVLESVPPRPRSSRPSAGSNPPVSELLPEELPELELDIPMDAPVEASAPPDVSDALEPIFEEVRSEEPRSSMRTVSRTPPPELEPVPASMPAQLYSMPTSQRPSEQPSWGEIVSGPPADPTAMLLGPHRASSGSPPPGPRPPERPSEEPMIEAVDHIGMTGDLLPQSRFLRSSLSPPSAPAPAGIPMPASSSWLPTGRPSSVPGGRRSSSVSPSAPARVSEPPLLELSEAEILPLEPAHAVAEDTRNTELEMEPVPAVDLPGPGPSAAPRVSDLSGLEIDSIASVLSASVDGEEPVALMVSAAPPPRPRPEQEARMLAAQVKQEIKDLLVGDVTPEARARVMRTLVAILEDEGFFSDERLLRAVTRIFRAT